MTCSLFQEAVQESDIDQLLMGMASQICEREDNIITPDLRGSVFGLLDFNRRDLMAVNIQVKLKIAHTVLKHDDGHHVRN